MKLTCHISTWECTNKRIIVRADLNVPLNKGTITNDMRLRTILPTLDEIIHKRATTILMTHLGRPEGYDISFSTRQLIPWFTDHNYSIIFASTIAEALHASLNNRGSIILLENLRFFPGEKEKSVELAQELAKLGDYFVQDAFGSLHNDETSITLLPEQFSFENRSIGLLVQKELQELTPLVTDPPHPFCLILGGKKMATKIPLIEHMHTRADHIILCPAMVFTFLKAQGKSVGKSLIDESMINACTQMLSYKNLVFPVDYQVAQADKDGPLSLSKTIAKNDVGISIGPKSIEQFSAIIHKAKIVFFNGAIGFQERPETLTGMKALFEAMAHSSGKSIVAGGDSIAAIEQFGIQGISYLSTGGGATLAYLSGEQLPGLKPFILENGTKPN